MLPLRRAFLVIGEEAVEDYSFHIALCFPYLVVEDNWSGTFYLILIIRCRFQVSSIERLQDACDGGS